MTHYCGLLATPEVYSHDVNVEILGHYVKGELSGTFKHHLLPTDPRDKFKKYYQESIDNGYNVPFYEYLNEELNLPVFKEPPVLNGNYTVQVLEGSLTAGYIYIDPKGEIVDICYYQNPVGVYTGFILGDRVEQSFFFKDARLPSKTDGRSHLVLKKADIDWSKVLEHWDNNLRPNMLVIGDFSDLNMRLIQSYNRGYKSSEEWELEYRKRFDAIPDDWYLTIFHFID